MLRNQSKSQTNESIIDKCNKRYEFCKLHFSTTKQLFENSYTNICKTQNDIIGACTEIMNIETQDQQIYNQNQNPGLFQQCEDLHEKILDMSNLAKESVLKFEKAQGQIQSFSNFKQIDIPIGLNEVITLKILITKLAEQIEKAKNIFEENEKIIQNYNDHENIITLSFNNFMKIINEQIEEYNTCIKNMSHNKKIYDEALIQQKIEQQSFQNAICICGRHLISHQKYFYNNGIFYNISGIQENIKLLAKRIDETTQKRQEEEEKSKKYINEMALNEKQKSENSQQYQNFLQIMNDKKVAALKVQNDNTEVLNKMKNQLENKQFQEQNIKNNLNFGDLIDTIKIIKWNNEVQTLHNKLECYVSIIHTYYKLCAENTQENLQKIKKLIEELNKKRQELLKEQKQEIISSLHKQILLVIKELFNDLEEQQRSLLEETLELGGEEFIKYIASCQSDDKIFKELNMASDFNKVLKLQEFISEQCRSVIDQQLVEIRDMFVSNMKPLSIAEDEKALSFLQRPHDQSTANIDNEALMLENSQQKSLQKKIAEKTRKQQPEPCIKKSTTFRDQIKKDKINNKGQNRGLDDFEFKIKIL